MKKFYFKMKGDLILDAIEYPHEYYTEIEVHPLDLPRTILGGYWRYVDGEFIEDLTLKPVDRDEEIEELKAAQKETDSMLLELMESILIQ